MTVTLYMPHAESNVLCLQACCLHDTALLDMYAVQCTAVDTMLAEALSAKGFVTSALQHSQKHSAFTKTLSQVLYIVQGPL